MADITMPQLGETVTEGTITRWFKKVGDQVAEDEPLFEVSTDKVDSEVPAASGGYLKEILVEEGETVDVGAKLAVIDDAPPSANGKAAPEKASEEPEAEDAAQEDEVRQVVPETEPQMDPDPEPAPTPAAKAEAAAPAAGGRRGTAHRGGGDRHVEAALERFDQLGELEHGHGADRFENLVLAQGRRHRWFLLVKSQAILGR